METYTMLFFASNTYSPLGDKSIQETTFDKQFFSDWAKSKFMVQTQLIDY